MNARIEIAQTYFSVSDPTRANQKYKLSDFPEVAAKYDWVNLTARNITKGRLNKYVKMLGQGKCGLSLIRKEKDREVFGGLKDVSLIFERPF